MFSLTYIRKFARSAELCALLLTFSLVLAAAMVGAIPVLAQDQPSSSSSSSSQTSGSQNPNQQEAPPEAGGPNGNTGPYAIPKKGEAPPPPPPEKPKRVEGMPDYSIQVNVPLVTVPVSVVSKDGQFIPGLKQDNFRVYEDGQQQTITDFKMQEAPITAVMLVEFASTTWPIEYEAVRGSYIFASTLKKDDWVAAISYDMKPQILVDFTQDKNALMQGLNQLQIPGFAETNLFDALYDTIDRLERVEGHKYIILISTGIDTFSRLKYDEILKKVKNSHDITIFPISIGWQLREYCEVNHCTGYSHGFASYGMSQIDWLQADNEMQTFAKLTGGRFYQPRFEGDYTDAFKDIGEDIRHEYLLAYRPTNAKLDGTYRKLKVDVVAPDGGPLKIEDQKHKEVKYQVIAREGYTAKHQVE